MFQKLIVHRFMVPKLFQRKFTINKICNLPLTMLDGGYGVKMKTTFASLFRDSPFCQIGIPEKKIALGEIIDVVDNDIYIDFGFKFIAVCRQPKQNAL